MGRPGQLAHGVFPPLLYRIFQDQDERYARDFVERGIIRFGRLQHYAQIEDKNRRDESEGSGAVAFTRQIETAHLDAVTLEHTRSTFALGTMHFSSLSVMPMFIACFSYPPEGSLDRLPRKFGRWAVRVVDPRRLAQDITDYLETVEFADFAIECEPVRYQHGEHLLAMPDFEERQKVSWAYKPALFCDEHEYRFLLTESMRAGGLAAGDDHRFVRLNRRIEYAELVELNEHPCEP